MAKYKSKDGRNYAIPGVGGTVDGIIETDEVIESSIFERIDEESQAGSVTGTASQINHDLNETAGNKAADNKEQ